jgi:hypothetical protein
MFDRIKQVLGLHPAGRQVEVFPDDVFIISYPKSGSTWMQFLVANLVYPEKRPDFSNLNQIIPAPEVTSVRDLAKVPRPRILKNHEYLDTRYRGVIYIVRDPRDVVLSQYHFHMKRRRIEEGYPIEKFVQRFLAGETSDYGSWGDNVGGWFGARGHSPGFLLIRYEDMLADTVGELAKVAEFLGIKSSDPAIARAVELSSADRMRQIEKNNSGDWHLTRNTRKDIPFVRTAKAGNWRAELPANAIANIEGQWGQLMGWLGYELVTKASETTRQAT